jgi:SAM-dependent methyltransferase
MKEYLNSTISAYLQQNPTQEMQIVDFGCGDATPIKEILKNLNLKSYIGIDGSEHVLQLAANQLTDINCEKNFICDNMENVIKELDDHSCDIIFSSYALHHLNTKSKSEFISLCYSKLKKNGFFFLVDVVLSDNHTRDDWLNLLEKRFYQFNPNVPENIITEMLKHPQESDFPENVQFFMNEAKNKPWGGFKVLFKTEITGIVMYSKDLFLIEE